MGTKSCWAGVGHMSFYVEEGNKQKLSLQMLHSIRNVFDSPSKEEIVLLWIVEGSLFSEYSGSLLLTAT